MARAALAGGVLVSGLRERRPGARSKIDNAPRAPIESSVLSVSHANSRSRIGRVLAAAGAATLNLVIPALLAWALAGALYRYTHPNLKVMPDGSGLGPVTAQLLLSGTNAGIPEPLVVSGVSGRASLIYIRVLRKDQAKMGIEFWGKKAVEGEPFPLPADNRIDITCSVPAFFPPVGNRQWRSVPESLQKQRHSEYVITVNGTVRLSGQIDYDEPQHSPLDFGVNRVGGSWVSAQFTGTVLKASQQSDPSRWIR